MLCVTANSSSVFYNSLVVTGPQAPGPRPQAPGPKDPQPRPQAPGHWLPRPRPQAFAPHPTTHAQHPTWIHPWELDTRFSQTGQGEPSLCAQLSSDAPSRERRLKRCVCDDVPSGKQRGGSADTSAPFPITAIARSVTQIPFAHLSLALNCSCEAKFGHYVPAI